MAAAMEATAGVVAATPVVAMDMGAGLGAGVAAIAAAAMGKALRVVAMEARAAQVEVA